ncbi:MAG TPA: alpha/beta hydrolase-fold protein [Chitinophagaceae bacterium]|jgi:polyhydroxybutyrate depolymerase|nr:alpha/beta hydrolase-fold protein [Chitinophagaceae bacterium]
MLRLLLISISCCCLQPVHAQLFTDSLSIEGKTRTFRYYRPEKAKKPLRIIFLLHGSGGNGEGMRRTAASLEAVAEAENLLLVYPDGYKRYWNECRKMAASEANKEDINEEAFFTEMLYYLRKRYPLREAVHAIGFSGGGHMAYKLALTLPQQFTSVTAIVANLPDSANLDCTASGTPVSVLIVNGTADEVNPYNGGPMMVNGASFGGVRSSQESLRYWAELAGYRGAPVEAALPDAVADDQTIVRHTFQAAGKPEITLLEVRGAGHEAPTDIDVFREALLFFKRNSRP